MAHLGALLGPTLGFVYVFSLATPTQERDVIPTTEPIALSEQCLGQKINDRLNTVDGAFTAVLFNAI